LQKALRRKKTRNNENTAAKKTPGGTRVEGKKPRQKSHVKKGNGRKKKIEKKAAAPDVKAEEGRPHVPTTSGNKP